MEEKTMARRPRASRLETRTARLKLAVRWKPYDFTTISPGIASAIAATSGAGVWVVRVADGKGGNWTKRVGLADDFEDADGEHVLTCGRRKTKRASSRAAPTPMPPGRPRSPMRSTPTSATSSLAAARSPMPGASAST